jgi:hypothetical protein
MLQNFVMFTAKFYVKSKVLETMYIVHIYVKSLKHIVYSKNIIRHDNLYHVCDHHLLAVSKVDLRSFGGLQIVWNFQKHIGIFVTED